MSWRSGGEGGKHVLEIGGWGGGGKCVLEIVRGGHVGGEGGGVGGGGCAGGRRPGGGMWSGRI